jgi:nucleolar pre-ribosomal-associated protein 1
LVKDFKNPHFFNRYWTAASLTLEPRLSSKWIANFSFFGLVISLPIPVSSFLMPDGISYQPTPPPPSVVLENVLPSVNTKAHFSRGLQSSFSLVRHCTALALAKCLIKLRSVLRTFDQIANVLEEEEGEGQWSRRRNELQREARRRVPDYQVLIAFSQLTAISGENRPESGTGKAEAPSNRTKAALLAESAQRLLWLYQQCLPEAVSESRFDFGKLLTHFLDETGSRRSISDGPSPDAAVRLHALCKLHILRLLKENDQFMCSGKTGKEFLVNS